MSSLSIKPPVLKKPSDHARHFCRACRSSGMYFTGLRMQVTIRADMSARRTLLPPVYQQSTGRCETKSIPSLANGRIITKQIMSFGKRKHPGETSSRNPQSQSAFPSWEGGANSRFGFVGRSWRTSRNKCPWAPNAIGPRLQGANRFIRPR